MLRDFVGIIGAIKVLLLWISTILSAVMRLLGDQSDCILWHIVTIEKLRDSNEGGI